MVEPPGPGGVRGDIQVRTRAVLARATDAFAGHPEVHARLVGHLDRLDAPVRIAIAGKVKAGKSTLLNALVGEIIAPTDAGECTRIVTWYQNAVVPRITLYPTKGDPRDLPIVRQDGRLQLGLGGADPATVERLVVSWPTGDLAATTLIDTPGISSASAETSARTEAFLTPAAGPEGAPGGADAIVYLMRHVHADDVGFLEAFHAHAEVGSSPVNTVAVLSRADEVGAGRVDALSSARMIARRMRADEKIRSLCQTVVPVAGLLAETGRTLRQAEFNALAAIAAADRELVEGMLLSADRFVRDLPPDAPDAEHAAPLPPAAVRAALLDRLGMFGVRVALPLIRQGCADAPALSADLVRRSGLSDLRDVLAALFSERAELLKARSALNALEGILRQVPIEETEELQAEVERIMSGAHEFAELALLGSLRSGTIPMPAELIAEAERLLGGSGQRPAARLGLPEDAAVADLLAAATEAMEVWRPRAENPVSVRPVADAARVVVRTCEGLIAALPPS